MNSLDVTLQTGISKSYSIGATGSADVNLFNGVTLSLKNIVFQVDFSEGALTDAAFYGVLGIGEIDIDLSATYSNSKNDGWVFVGGPPSFQAISITNLIQDLFNEFDPPIELSPFFPNLTITNLRVEIDTAPESLKLTVNINQNASLLIQLDKNKSDEWQSLVGLFYQPNLDLMSYIPILNQSASEPLKFQQLDIIYASAADISYIDPIDITKKIALQGFNFHADLLLGDKVFSFPEDTQESYLSIKANSATPSSTSPILSIPIQKTIGPLQFEKMGIGFAGKDLILSVDLAVAIEALSFELIGFSLGVSLEDPSPEQWEFNLNGLGLSYQSGPIEISGTLLRLAGPQSGQTEFDGQAIINTEEFGISALGSLITGQGPASLFVFALVDANIGGPPAFFVTGLAAGFGYNRSLIPPPLEQFNTFPLVQAFSDPGALVGPNDPSSPEALAYALTTLDEVIPEKIGEYWFAAGIRFTSFELINSMALAIVEMGKDFEIIILGKSFASLPAQGESYVYVELDLEVIFNPEQGLFQASALLSNNSYVLDPNCHLTGGFGFNVWFGSNVHAGEFIFTIGGYHPAFIPPSYYPTEPRLGFNWNPSSDVTIKGGAYFALAPSCLMAGGSLEVLFQSGGLRAWLTACADILAHWNPFYFIADIGITVGCSYRLDLLFVTVTLKVELGANLTLWGPPTGGTAHIDWYIISFSIPFGADQKESQQKISWDTFQTMLPQSQQSKLDINKRPLPHLSQNSAEIIHISINSGLLRQINSTDETIRFLVRADEFTFSVESAVPLKQINFEQMNYFPIDQGGQPVPNYFVAIRPMQIDDNSSNPTISCQTITITSRNGYAMAWEKSNPLIRDMPSSLWGHPIDSKNIDPNDRLMENRLVGLKITPQSQNQTGHTGPIDLQSAFTYFPIDEQNQKIPSYLPLSINPVQYSNTPQKSDQALVLIENTLEQTAITRTNLLKDLGTLIGFINQNDSLNYLAQNVVGAFEAEPLLGPLSLNPSGEKQ